MSNVKTTFTKHVFDYIDQQQSGDRQEFEPMIKFLEQLSQVVSMKFKPEQKSIRSLSHQRGSQKALFSRFKGHRHGVETLNQGFKRKSFMPNAFHKLPLACVLWQD